jgi:hypothetical protein
MKRTDMRAPELRRAANETIHDRIIPIQAVLERLRAENRVLGGRLIWPVFGEERCMATPAIDIGIYLRTDDEARADAHMSAAYARP